MTWLKFLFNTSLAVHLLADLAVVFCVFPAYQATRNRAFLYIFWSCLLGIFIAICDHTIGLGRMAGADYTIYRTLRTLSYFACTLLGAVGTIQLSKSFLRIWRSRVLDARCPKCGVEWALNSVEASQPEFVCADCQTRIPLREPSPGARMKAGGDNAGPFVQT